MGLWRPLSGSLVLCFVRIADGAALRQEIRKSETPTGLPNATAVGAAASEVPAELRASDVGPRASSVGASEPSVATPALCTSYHLHRVVKESKWNVLVFPVHVTSVGVFFPRTLTYIFLSVVNAFLTRT